MDAPLRHDLVRSLLSARTTLLADVDRSPDAPERLLLRTDLTGTFQVHERAADGTVVALTELPEPVTSAHYVPGTRRAILEADAGGNERGQLFVLDLDRDAPASRFDELTPITADARHAHHLAGISPDGQLLAYVSNAADGVDFDLYACDLQTLEHRPLWRSGGWAHPASGFSPDGRHVSVLVSGERPLDVRLVLVPVAGGEPIVLATPGRASLFGAPAWLGPDAFLVASNADGDMSAIVRHTLDADSAPVTIEGSGERFDAEVVSSRDGSTAIAIENRDGAMALRIIDLDANRLGAAIQTPEAGVVAPMLSRDGATVLYTLTAPRIPGDVFAHDLRTRTTRRLSETPTEIPAAELATPELGEVQSFDGETIPYFVYRPRERGGGPRPVVVHVHGGPESQATRIFSPVIQALVAAGFGVVVPNVRGSTGYGKRYASLDDTTRRLDSVADLAAIHGTLDDIGFDAARAALWGGSYGGYMVLAGLAFQPELWAAGVDIVGISNLVTFLENTSAYRRAHRELEYGSLQRDRDFLMTASPLTHVDAMRAPLFVIHGRNDPRVPVGEAEQLVARLLEHGVRCELAIYEDEGHGLARLANRLDAYPRAIAFLQDALGC